MAIQQTKVTQLRTAKQKDRAQHRKLAEPILETTFLWTSSEMRKINPGKHHYIKLLKEHQLTVELGDALCFFSASPLSFYDTLALASQFIFLFVFL